jgi:hypothetical protein
MNPAAAIQVNPFQQNAQNRALVLAQSVNMFQYITSTTIFPSSNPQWNVQPRFVGLIKRFYVVVTGTINNSGSTTISLTDYGVANILSNVIYTDPANNQRHNTLGLHLALLATAKRRMPFAASIQANTALGNNLSQGTNAPPASWGVHQAPQTIAASANGTFRTVYEIPLAYSDQDLRGAVYSNLVNATQNLTLTANQNPVTANPADNTYAVYSGAAGSAGSITSLTFTLYQEYLDQLPQGQNGQPILPGIDLSTIYQLKNTNFTAITNNQAFYVAYNNFNSFLSTFAIYNNSGTNSGRTYGSDVTWWQLVAANLTNLWQIDPLVATQLSRDHIHEDLPSGTYYFPSRAKPLLTNQYGNLQLALTPSTAGAGATLQVMWEYMASLNTAGSGGSLASS